MISPINKRLLCCASLVRDGAVLGDVGTDHGYLPIYLLKVGKIDRAVLSDINEGPLSKARENVSENSLCDKCRLVLCDGASAISDLGITDYCIAGMGGELIASILSKAPHLKDGAIRLVLQPMSRPEALRAFLWDNGFRIITEQYVVDDGKKYVCICAEYKGEPVDYSVADSYFGKEECFLNVSPAMLEYMNERKCALLRMIEGKHRGGIDARDDEELFSELVRRLSGRDI